MIHYAVCIHEPPEPLNAIFKHHYTYEVQDDFNPDFYIYDGYAIEKTYFSEGKKISIKCINEIGRSSLEFRAIYKAYEFKEFPNDYFVMTNQKEWLSKTRFEVVMPEVKLSVKIDNEEELYWKLLKPTILPDHCVCGILKSKCSYHG